MTGMSGAGKSQAVNALEDMGYYCVDNVPPSLIPKFVELPRESKGKIAKVALVVDVRSHGMFADFLACLEELKELRFQIKTVFLDCDDSVISTRYKETRRRHPLLSDEVPSLADAIAKERELTAPARGIADYIINTSLLGTAQLKSRVRELFGTAEAGSMVVTCMSFGFKFGLPADSDLVFDVRCLPNPFYVPELKELAGTDPAVRDYVMSFSQSGELAAKIADMLDFLVPLYTDEGKSQLVISFGCTGGKHRSVVFAEHIAGRLGAGGVHVNTSHRDIGKHRLAD